MSDSINSKRILIYIIITIFVLTFSGCYSETKQINLKSRKEVSIETPTSKIQHSKVKGTPKPSNPTSLASNKKSKSESKEIRGNTQSNIINGGYAAINDGVMYYSAGMEGMQGFYKVSVGSDKPKKIADNGVKYINIIGDIIICAESYLSQCDNGYSIKYRLISMNNDGSNKKILSEDEPAFVQVVNDCIYYSNLSDGARIYSMKIDGTGKKKLNEDESQYLNVGNGWIYYINNSVEYAIYRIKTDGTKRELVELSCCESMVLDGDILYASLVGDNTNEDLGGLYSIKIDGSDKIKISDERADSINVQNDLIYLTSCKNDWTLSRMNKDGTGIKSIINGYCTDIQLIDRYIFYGQSSGNGIDKVERKRINIDEKEGIKLDCVVSPQMLNKIIWYCVAVKNNNQIYSFVDYDLIDNDLKNDQVSKLLEGLEYDSPLVKWYCAYKISEFMNDDNKRTVKSALEKQIKNVSRINNAKTGAVKNELSGNDEQSQENQKLIIDACSFTLDIINEEFNKNEFVENSDGSRIAFVKYAGARNMDGEVWEIADGKMSRLYKNDMNIDELSWSPDGTWFSAFSYGRYWGNMVFVNTQTKSKVDANFMNYITTENNQFRYKIGKNYRPDPYSHLIEWSPDGNKALLSYSFTDDELQMHTGIFLFDPLNNSFERFTELSDIKEYNPSVEKPANFKW